MNEAIGLASMNPIPGAVKGALFINNMPEDKDLKDVTGGWGKYRVTRDFSNKNSITLNEEGKIVLTDNSDLDNAQASVYFIRNENVDNIFNEVLSELEINIQERPVHGEAYLYEIFTGHNLYTKDQLDYDPLLEKVYLDKVSKRINSNIDGLDIKEHKDSRYPLEGHYEPDEGREIEESFSSYKMQTQLERLSYVREGKSYEFTSNKFNSI